MSPLRHASDTDDATTPEQALAAPHEPSRPAEIVEYVAPPPYLAGIPIISDTDELTMRTIERSMSATTPEELLSDPDAGSLRDLVGQIITVTGVVGIMPSKYNTANYYLVFEAITTEGQAPSILSTGSPYAASRIAVLVAKGWAPRRVRVIELESAANPGQSSLWVTDAGPVLAETHDEGL